LITELDNSLGSESSESRQTSARIDLNGACMPQTILRSASLAEDRTQNMLNFVSGLPLSELKAIKAFFAEKNHKDLLELKKANVFSFLMAQDGCCPGTLMDALISQPEAARYVSGSVCPNRSGVLLFTPDQKGLSFHDFHTGQMFNHFVADFARINDLPGDLILGVNGRLTYDSHSLNKITVYIGERGKALRLRSFSFSRSTNETQIERWRANQVLSAIAALHQLAEWINEHSGKKEVSYNANPKEIHVRSQKFQLSEEILAIKKCNDKLWRILRSSLKRHNHPGLVIGESFTGGKLASLLHSLPKSSRLVHTSLVWYTPEFKLAFDVADSDVVSFKIAGTDTTKRAAVGLLNNTSVSLGTAIATSGFTNYLKAADNFSISVVDRAYIGKKLVEREFSARVNVVRTAVQPPSYQRKEHTRQVGTAVALILLAKALEERYNFSLTDSDAFKQLDTLIKSSSVVNELKL
jgi:nicotinamide mononucleotide (NMN) deamidase PncC